MLENSDSLGWVAAEPATVERPGPGCCRRRGGLGRAVRLLLSLLGGRPCCQVSWELSPYHDRLSVPAGHQGSFCMLCVMQNHIIQAFANSGNAIKPVSFIRDLRSKSGFLLGVEGPEGGLGRLHAQSVAD